VTLRLCLVRHGSTDWSDAGRFDGWTDVPLNERGRRQARELASTLDPSAFDGIWSSDLRRASETAALAVGGAVSDRRLRELDFGELEGLTWDECVPAVRAELAGFDGFRAPSGESTTDLRQRVTDLLAEIDDGDHLLFTHGGVIRLLTTASAMPGLGRPVRVTLLAAADPLVRTAARRPRSPR
jgi:probable phosphoglycerate mutase